MAFQCYGLIRSQEYLLPNQALANEMETVGG